MKSLTIVVSIGSLLIGASCFAAEHKILISNEGGITTFAEGENWNFDSEGNPHPSAILSLNSDQKECVSGQLKTVASAYAKSPLSPGKKNIPIEVTIDLTKPISYDSSLDVARFSATADGKLEIRPRYDIQAKCIPYTEGEVALRLGYIAAHNSLVKPIASLEKANGAPKSSSSARIANDKAKADSIWHSCREGAACTLEERLDTPDTSGRFGALSNSGRPE